MRGRFGRETDQRDELFLPKSWPRWTLRKFVSLPVRHPPTPETSPGSVCPVCLILPAGQGIQAVPAWRRGVGPGPAATALARLIGAAGADPPTVLGKP